MEVGDFRTLWLNELREVAEAQGTLPAQQFIEKAVEEMIDLKVWANPIISPVHIRDERKRLMRFDAYGYDEADSSLYMVISDFSNEIQPTNLTNTQIQDYVKQMQLFLDKAINGNIQTYVDASNEVIDIAKNIKKWYNEIRPNEINILKFKFYIISNNPLSHAVKDTLIDDFLGKAAALEVWHIERFFTNRNGLNEIIDVDTTEFGCEGIPVLKADLGNNSDYEAYLGIVPGRLLSKMYVRYGSRLLQGNIRAFLSNTKINIGIRKTIVQEPYNFFTYNNGIAVTARSIVLSKDHTKVIALKDPQIINGGQTTASLASAVAKREVDKEHGLDNVFVPMKLTVLNVGDTMNEEEQERYDDMTENIAKYANKQNATKDSDFFSNHPFHREMEKLSEKYLAPTKEGGLFPTRWFYERSRGKWEQGKMLLTKAKADNYVLHNPKKQIVKKEKFAKCYNTAILMNPHQATKGLVNNFKVVAPILENLYDNHKADINETFFKKSICTIIMYDELDVMIANADWYTTGGNKAEYVPYTIAKLMHSLPKGKTLDWNKIWQNQTIPIELRDQLISVAYKTQLFLKKEAGDKLIRTVSQDEKVWKKYAEIPLTLNKAFEDSLILESLQHETDNQSKRQKRFELGLDAGLEVFAKGIPYWEGVNKDINQKKYVTAGDCDFLDGVIKYMKRGNLPTPAQCRRLQEVINKAEDNGYLLP